MHAGRVAGAPRSPRDGDADGRTDRSPRALAALAAFAAYLRYREANDEALLVLVHALEAKDRYTAGHAERVAAYARYMGEHLGLHGHSLERLRRAALMHDIGKLVVPNQLLNKPGPLTAAEYERVRQHEDVTVALLSRIDFLAPVAPIALGVYAPWDDDHRPEAVAGTSSPWPTRTTR